MLSTTVSIPAILFQDGNFYYITDNTPDTTHPLGDTAPWYADRVLELDAASGSLCVIDLGASGLRSSTYKLRPGEVFFKWNDFLTKQACQIIRP